MTTPTRKIDATGLPLTRRRALQGAGIAGLAAAFASLPFTRPARADDITLVPNSSVKAIGGKLKGQIQSETAAAVRILAGGKEQNVRRQHAAVCFRCFQCEHPAADCSGHRESCKRPPRRDRLEAFVEIGVGIFPGRPRRHDRTQASVWKTDQPKAVAADVSHVRINDGDHRRHRDHRFEGVASLGEDRPAGFHGFMVWRADDAAAMTGSMQLHAG